MSNTPEGPGARELEETRQAPGLADELAETRRKLAVLQAEHAKLEEEHADLTLLCEATIAHGEAVEDQLAESNIVLQRTQERLEKELHDAARYAMAILPPPRAGRPAAEWHYEPCTELGGDSFGYYDIGQDCFCIFLIDVCDHGVGAALLATTVTNVLRTQAMPDTDFLDPSSVLGALNDTFPMEEQGNMFFTIWYGIHHRGTGELRYASAGHPPAVLIRNGPDRSGGAPADAAELLWVSGNVAMGTFPGLSFRDEVTRVHPDDQLLVFSDGVYEVDATDDDGMLEVDDFVRFMQADPDRGPQDAYQWVRTMNGDEPLPDDFSLLRVRF